MLINMRFFGVRMPEAISTQRSADSETNLDTNKLFYDTPEKMPVFCAAYMVSFAAAGEKKGIWQTVSGLTTETNGVITEKVLSVADRFCT